MATHHGKEGVVTIGGTTLGNATGFTVDTTHDVVEDTALGNSMKSYLVDFHNIPSNDILLEPKSRDTVGDAVYTRKFIEDNAVYAKIDV